MNDPAFTIALALALGMIAQSAARHIKIPGIVLLLAGGVLAGPDGLNMIRPETLGEALPIIVGFAVAIILFEGGMNLRFDRLKREGKTIKSLISVGAIITAIGGTLSAKLFLGWDWSTSVLFGLLVIVTGPTVINPLLRRIKLRQSVATLLEAEGILLDAIGAIIAVVALEVVLSPSGFTFLASPFIILGRLFVGGLIGIIGGFIIAWLLGIRNLVPEGLENVFTLSLVFALFQISNVLSHESGIVAVTIAGMVVGNRKTLVTRELMEFKEQMTVMLIGMLFVLLAADVRMFDVYSLGMGGLYTVLALVFIVRPLNIIFGTINSDLTIKQKALLAWIAPRGIVAAAVASYFAIELEKNGVDGSQLRAMIFLLIAVTVLSAGLTGGLAAQLLGLKRKSENGWIILGANAVARALARLLQSENEEIVLIDENPSLCRLAEKENLRVIYGNGMEESVLLRAAVDLRKGAIGLSENEEVNMLFANRAKEVGKVSRIYVGLKRDDEGITSEMVNEIGGRIPFARAMDLEKWAVWVRKEQTEKIKLTCNSEVEIAADKYFGKSAVGLLIPLISQHQKSVVPVGHNTILKKGDIVTCLVLKQKTEQFNDWMLKSPFTKKAN
ncbi:MAG: sodium:proton exchanger [Candidatus Marinimicrobia bacterium]|nr:sodium:proton exchanger [Candidatus Neomarinimicrobiota bacterium]MBT3675957.1 sodium:proton exchanger [Candidatus Neomarinimicrobiota bacterium]MBT3762472.1 sodium:proton exchanger [Candidatus Neomarinimicrobiota bacterium]MBT4068038.1 sodium:proton exchanger [Candidatus Neomarinimicrobiota bacterium]MBT4270219.1 sodium:proton exchanger [Candidatus Neomarinimicrobiota bacterium]